MLEGINGLNPANGNQDVKATTTTKQRKINSLFGVKKTANEGQVSGSHLDKIMLGHEGKTVTTINDDGSKTEKTYSKDGKLEKEVIYKDVNGDGKEDIYSITRYHEAWENPATGEKDPKQSWTYIDEDGDGYMDCSITRTYDEKGKVKTETKNYLEAIDDVKKREHFPWEIHNRSMDVQNGGYIMF